MHQSTLLSLAALLACSSLSSVDAFSTVSLHQQSPRMMSLLQAKKKGFGSTKSKKSKKTDTSSSPAAATESTPPSALEVTTPPTPEPAPLNAGQLALQEMRRKKAEEKNAELQKMRQVVQADQQVQETPAAIPEKVAQRMGNRMLAFVGLPLFVGLGSFVGFWYFATYKNLEFQPALVAATTIGMLAISLLGITYSVMSTSWDEDRTETDGFLGVGEFQKNVDNVKEGLSRSKENAILREKMATANPQQLQKVLETPKESKPKATSLGDKLNQELE